MGLANATFERHDLAELDKVRAYDVMVTIRRQARRRASYPDIYRALRDPVVCCVVVKASSQLEDNVGVPLSTCYNPTSLMCTA